MEATAPRVMNIWPRQSIDREGEGILIATCQIYMDSGGVVIPPVIPLWLSS